MNNQIEVKHVSVKYGNHTVLEDVSFSIKKGDYIGLVGANGSGKTTLVKSLLGLIEIEKGQIVYANPNIKKGYLPQDRKSTRLNSSH